MDRLWLWITNILKRLEVLESAPSGAMTASQILTALLTVDGAGSGLDADKLDGQEGSYYLPAGSYTAADVLAKLLTVDGPSSGLDADLLDGNSSAFFQPASTALTTTNMNAQSQIMQAFSVEIKNNGGTIQHRFGAVSIPGTAGNLYAKLNSPSTTATTTPTGTDSSTAMAGGGKISSAATQRFIIDTTADQPSEATFNVMAFLAYNDSATALQVAPILQRRNVNGVTRNRIELEFRVASSGAARALNTTNIAAGKFIVVNVHGYLT